MTDNYTPFEYMHRLMTEMDEMMAQMRQSAWDQGNQGQYWNWDQQRARPMLTDGSHADSTSSPARWQGTGVGLHMNVSADFYDALDGEVSDLLEQAAHRAQENDRKTVQPRDL